MKDNSVNELGDLVNDCISRKAAIDIVNKYNKSHMILMGKPMLCAAPIVIELEDLPSAQPETAERTAEAAQNVSDSDLVSRKAAIDAIRASTSKYTGFMEMEMYTDDDAVEAIEDLPSAQPVITCDGCKFVGTYNTDFPCRNCIRREKDYYAQE